MAEINSGLLSFAIIINAIFIGIWLYILNYMYKLHQIGCTCAEDWRRKAIMYYIIFLFILFVIRITGILSQQMMMFISPILFLITIAFIIIIFQYIRDLKAKLCTCSESTARTVLEIINYIQMAFVLLLLISIIFVILNIANYSDQLREITEKTKN
jgi:hypothetical protein